MTDVKKYTEREVAKAARMAHRHGADDPFNSEEIYPTPKRKPKRKATAPRVVPHRGMDYRLVNDGLEFRGKMGSWWRPAFNPNPTMTEMRAYSPPYRAMLADLLADPTEEVEEVEVDDD